MKKLIIFLNLLSIAWGVQEIHQKPPYPVLKFKFEVNPKNTSGLLAQLINSEDYATYNPKLPANQLLINTNIHELTLAQWTNAVRRANLNFSAINVEKLKEITRTLHINTSIEYKDFIQMVEDPFLKMGRSFAAINVSELQVMSYTMYNSIGDEKFFDAFINANFSNFPEALKILDIPEQDVFEFAKRRILKYLGPLGNVPLTDFSRLVKNLTGNYRNLLEIPEDNNLFKFLMDELEIYENPQEDFREIIQHFNATIQNPLILATRISTSHYLTSGVIYDEIKRMAESYTQPFLVEPGENGGKSQKHEIKILTFNGSFVQLQTSDNVTYNAPNGTVTQLTQCLYATSPTSTLPISITYIKFDQLYTKRNINGKFIEFVMGAPLFCDNQLVGVALTETQNNLIFAKVPFDLKLSQGQNDTAIPSDNQPPPVTQITSELIAKIDFKLIEEKLANFIGYLLMDTLNGNLSRTNVQNVTAIDVIHSFEFDQISYQEFSHLLGKIPSGNSKHSKNDDCLGLIQRFNVSMIKIYQNLIPKLNETQKAEIFKAVNLNYTEIQRLLLYYPNNEGKFKEFISRGNFNKPNVENAFKVGNITKETVYDVIKHVVLENIQNSTLENILNLIKVHGGYPTLKEYLKTHKIEPKIIRTYTGYEEILHNFEKRLQSSASQGPVISKTNILTVNQVFDNYNDEVTQEFVEIQVATFETFKLQQNNLEHFQSVAKNVTPYSSGYANITLNVPLPETQILLPIASDLHPRECKMVSVDAIVDLPKVANTKYGYEVVLSDKISLDMFEPGAGLICQGRLYGVATVVENKKIKFGGFKDGVHPVEIQDETKPSKGFAGSFCGNWVVLIVCLMVSFKVM